MTQRMPQEPENARKRSRSRKKGPSGPNEQRQTRKKKMRLGPEFEQGTPESQVDREIAPEADRPDTRPPAEIPTEVCCERAGEDERAAREAYFRLKESARTTAHFEMGPDHPLRMHGDDSELVGHDAATRVVLSLAGKPAGPPGVARGKAKKAARNRVISGYRKKQNHQGSNEDADGRPIDVPFDAQIERDVDRARLIQFIDQLEKTSTDAELRELRVLRLYLKGCGTKDIEALGGSKNPRRDKREALKRISRESLRRTRNAEGK